MWIVLTSNGTLTFCKEPPLNMFIEVFEFKIYCNNLHIYSLFLLTSVVAYVCKSDHCCKLLLGQRFYFPPDSVAALCRFRTLTLCLVLSGAAAENMLGSLLCLPGSSSVLLDPYGSTMSETTSEAWSVEVLPSDSGGNEG